jgi:hypothetical protein
MAKYRYPTELLHAYPSGMREINAPNDEMALRVGRSNGASLEMNNMQVHFHGRWRNVVSLRRQFAETQRLITESDCRSDYPSHERS